MFAKVNLTTNDRVSYSYYIYLKLNNSYYFTIILKTHATVLILF